MRTTIDLVRRFRLVIGIVVGILVLLFVPFILTGFYLTVVTQVLIYGMLAVSINLLMGYTGLSSLGHAAFFGVGAYAAAYLTAKDHMGFLPALLVSIVFSALVSVVFGAVAIRATGLYFLMITLALNMLVYGTAFTLYSITGAENGILGVNRPDLLAADWQYYYFCALIFIIALFLMWRLVRSPFGLTLMGIRESESRMRTLGYNVWLHKLIAFTISGSLAGFAGGMYAFYAQYVSVQVVDLQVSVEGVLAVIIGGIGTLFGPVLGAAVVIFAKELVSLQTDRWQTLLGVVLILVVIFARNGILGLYSQWQTRRRQASQATAAQAGAPPELAVNDNVLQTLES